MDEQTRADYLVRAFQYGQAHWQPWIGLMSMVYIADPEWTVRRQAALALGQIGPPARPSVPALKKLLAESDLLVRKAAQEALENWKKGGRGYVVPCPGCGAVYSWTPELEITDAICTKCGKTYNCEFGIPAG